MARRVKVVGALVSMKIVIAKHVVLFASFFIIANLYKQKLGGGKI
ncbi:MAG: hypothetical protein RXR08_12025 [Sulfolobaceae archaeon]